MNHKKKGLTKGDRAKEGGYARAKALTPEQRKDIAKRAAAARWGRRPDPPALDGDMHDQGTDQGTDPVTTLANRLIRVCWNYEDFVFILRQTSHSGRSNLDAYLPPNLSPAMMAFTTATILIEKSTEQQIEMVIESQIRVGSANGRGQNITLDFALMKRIRSLVNES